MKRPVPGTTLLRAFCDLCRGEMRTRHGEVGTVTAHAGALRWLAQNARGRRRLGDWAGQVLRQPGYPDLAVPQRLRSYCRYHGWRCVATSDVLAACAAGHRTAAPPSSPDATMI